MQGHHSIDYRTMLYRWQALFETVASDPQIVKDPWFIQRVALFDADLETLEKIDPVGAKLLKGRIDVQTGVSGVNIERWK